MGLKKKAFCSPFPILFKFFMGLRSFQICFVSRKSFLFDKILFGLVLCEEQTVKLNLDLIITIRPRQTYWQSQMFHYLAYYYIIQITICILIQLRTTIDRNIHLKSNFTQLKACPSAISNRNTLATTLLPKPGHYTPPLAKHDETKPATSPMRGRPPILYLDATRNHAKQR